jgi:hypothetical protein
MLYISRFFLSQIDGSNEYYSISYTNNMGESVVFIGAIKILLRLSRVRMIYNNIVLFIGNTMADFLWDGQNLSKTTMLANYRRDKWKQCVWTRLGEIPYGYP